MISDNNTQIMPKDVSSGIIDNSKQIISGFWEKSGNAPNRMKENNVQRALDIIGNSRETIFIYTPRIAAGDLLLELEKKQNDGVRIYLLVNNLDTHYSNKILEHFGIARERADITSTFVISDPENGCTGIWFEGDLSSKGNSSPIILDLNNKQAYEAYCHFTHLWWKSEGDEIKGNRKIKTKKIHPKAPEYASLISSAFRIDALDKLVSEEIQEICLSNNAPESAAVFLDDSNRVSCVVNEKSREYIEDADGATITGYNYLPFSFISDVKKTIAFSGDFGFILDERQKKNASHYTSSPDWDYITKKEIGNIQGMILPSDSDWDSKNAISIESEKIIPLDDVFANSIDDWVRGECRPKYPDKLCYANSIEYTWKIVPPILPLNAKKHALYSQWSDFEIRVKRACQEILSEIERYENSLEGLKKITKQNLISDQKGRLNSFLKTEWAKETDIQKASDALKKLEIINEAIFQELEELKKNDVKESETNEYSESSGKNKEIKKKTVSKKANPGSIAIPKHPLPKAGILYRVGNDDYLAIKRTDEIETAKKEILIYTNCRLVAEKTW
ncbi:hypothetical protein [Methanogenium cariaci]|jgi:hypothetical protein